MPIHFNTNGSVSVDSVEEAIRFEQLRSRTPRASKQKYTKRKGPRPPGWEGFLSFLSGPDAATARKILALVQGSATGIDRHRLAQLLEVQVQVITGTVTGISKKCTASGIAPNDVITRDADGIYRPGRLLVQHGAPMP